MTVTDQGFVELDGVVDIAPRGGVVLAHTLSPVERAQLEGRGTEVRGSIWPMPTTWAERETTETDRPAEVAP